MCFYLQKWCKAHGVEGKQNLSNRNRSPLWVSCCFTSTNNWLLHSHVLMLLIHSYATVTEVIRRMTAVTLASYPRQSVSASDHCQTQKTEQERNRTTLAENSLKLPSLGDIFKKWAIFTATLSVKWTRNFLTIKLSVGTTCCTLKNRNLKIQNTQK